MDMTGEFRIGIHPQKAHLYPFARYDAGITARHQLSVLQIEEIVHLIRFNAGRDRKLIDGNGIGDILHAGFPHRVCAVWKYAQG